MNHSAILKAYPNVVTIDDEAGAFDVNGDLVKIDPKKVALAEAELKEAFDKAEAENKAKRDLVEAKLAALGLTAEDLKIIGL